MNLFEQQETINSYFLLKNLMCDDEKIGQHLYNHERVSLNRHKKGSQVIDKIRDDLLQLPLRVALRRAMLL